MCDGRRARLPSSPALRMEETDGGISHHLLITLLESGNKAAAASAAVSARFHFLCGRKLSQHTADRHRPYPANHLSGFIEGEADCQSRSSTCSRRAQWGEVETQHQPSAWWLREETRTWKQPSCHQQHDWIHNITFLLSSPLLSVFNSEL